MVTKYDHDNINISPIISLNDNVTLHDNVTFGRITQVHLL